jgi:surfactin synthase thioesterase subunit
MTDSGSIDPTRQWFVPLPPQTGTPVRVVAIPHAGAGCGYFGILSRSLRGRLDVWAANLPGRQARFREPACTRYGPLSDSLAEAIVDTCADRPYVMLGYCSGALLAYGVVRELARRDAPPPLALVVVSFPAPHIAARYPDVSGLPSDEFWSRLEVLGGVPPELTSPQYRSLFEPALRADYAVVGDYRDDRDAPALSVPITAVVGDADPGIPVGTAAAWARYTGEFSMARVERGGHWLLEERRVDVEQVLLDVALARFATPVTPSGRQRNSTQPPCEPATASSTRPSSAVVRDNPARD